MLRKRVTVITWERLTELLEYSSETGMFTWITNPRRGPRMKGRQVGTVQKQSKFRTGPSYITVAVDGVSYLAHRLAFFYTTKRWPDQIDHKDRDGLNNKWDNIRECGSTLNRANMVCRKNTRTGVKGVTWNKEYSRFYATICIDGNRQHLGSYLSKEEAGAAYAEAARKHFGEFACWEAAL